jgi:hypothetical protein
LHAVGFVSAAAFVQNGTARDDSAATFDAGSRRFVVVGPGSALATLLGWFTAVPELFLVGGRRSEALEWLDAARLATAAMR